MKILILLITLALPACAIYSPSVDQGNIITTKMIDKLKPRMTRAQIKFIMGTPLLTNAYDQDRWDYVYMVNRKTEAVVTILFDDDKAYFIQYW